ncbi:MAG: hypothetical protein RSD61_01430 [Ruthenibacterium sp.]
MRLMRLIAWIVILGGVDLIGRVIALMHLMHHSAVRTFKYQTWVLLCAFLNFAWVFYWIFAFEKNKN